MTSQAKKIKQKKIIAKLPDAPGVYFFRRGKGNAKSGGGKVGEILYIGKATSLRDRVRSYFASDISEKRSPLISKMLSQFDDIKFQQTDSVLEALVLEANLIKKYQPEANIKEKDNRSFNFVVITDESFPRVLIVRGRELLQNKVSRTPLDMRSQVSKGVFDIGIAYSFGPFPNGSQLKEAMKIIRKMFPYRDKCIPASELKLNQKIRPCFNRQIGLCPGVCTGEISEKEYKQTIKNIILFFESDKKKLIKNLQKQMKNFAKAKEFEKAGKIKKTIFTLNHIQDISLIKENQTEKNKDEKTFRIESYDIAHMSGQNMVGVMTVVDKGVQRSMDEHLCRKYSCDEGSISHTYGEARPGEYRKFKIRGQSGVNDTKALAEILTRRLGHIEWRMADLIVVDGGVAQKNAMEKVLRENHMQIPVMSVVKDDHHKPKQILGDKKWLSHEREILLSNSEAHRYAIAYHKKIRNKILK